MTTVCSSLAPANRLIPNRVVCGVRGLGIKGSQVPSAGRDWPAPLYNSLSLPADADKEYRIKVESGPTQGTLVLGPLGEATVAGLVDGSLSFSVRAWEDGVDRGLIVTTATIGGSGPSPVNVTASVTGIEAEAAELGTVVATASDGVPITPINVVVAVVGLEAPAAESGSVVAKVVSPEVVVGTSSGVGITAAGEIVPVLEGGGAALLKTGEVVVVITGDGYKGSVCIRANGTLTVIG